MWTAWGGMSVVLNHNQNCLDSHLFDASTSFDILLVGTRASHRMKYKVVFHSWVEFLPIFNDVGAWHQMGFPEFQWCKGHGLPRSGSGHYGLREKYIIYNWIRKQQARNTLWRSCWDSNSDHRILHAYHNIPVLADCPSFLTTLFFP